MKPPSRPVGRVRPGAALLAGISGLAALLGVLASPGDASPRVEPPAAPGPLRIGMNSCASRGCHGAVDATEPSQGRVYIKDGAFTTWLNYDPHARAYAVLLEPRSLAIADKLQGPLGGKPAREAGLCLSCHATVGPPVAKSLGVAPLSDGISCEACHGPAETWRDKHLSPVWRTELASKNNLDGMLNLDAPAARAGLCVGCHVGDQSRGMDVNHDLIAAGHPRLNFEFATYLAGYPKHWREDHEKAGAGSEKTRASAQFEAKSWAIGQVVTARAVLGLLAARALASQANREKNPPPTDAVWPEFSEYECFACHHDLTDPRPRPKPDRLLGRLPWQTWPVTMLPSLAKDRQKVDRDSLGKIRVEMAHPVPDPKEVARLAAEVKEQLSELLEVLKAETFDPSKIDALVKDLASRLPATGESWDQTVQRLLALQALARATKGSGVAIGPEVEATIREGSALLDFLPKFDSPRNVSPPAKPNDPARPVR